MRNTLLIIALAISLISAGHHYHHKCIHDQLSKRVDPSQFEADTLESSDIEERNL